jgi:predicted DCC family thiol-disulfide oxidoreductase YuxK
MKTFKKYFIIFNNIQPRKKRGFYMHENPVILFDGVCNFCNGSINFLIRMDKKGLFRFSAIQSEAGATLLKNLALPAVPDSFILLFRNKIYEKSSATLIIFNMLPWYWKWTQLFWIVPGFIRNAVYDFISRNRYKWFGKKDSCMIPNAEIRKRFL